MRGTALLNWRVFEFIDRRCFHRGRSGFLAGFIDALLEPVANTVWIRIVNQIIVVPNEPVPPGRFLITGGTLEVAGKPLRGTLAREGLSILHADH